MQWGKQPQHRAFRRLSGCLEVGSGWRVDALNVAGVEHTTADDISRWNSEAVDGNLHVFRPDVASHCKVLGTADVAILSELWANSLSASR